jgi:uncharacterized membrane-anchored protein
MMSTSSFAELSYEDFVALDWQYGPKTQNILGKSTIFVPEGFLFLNVKDTDKYLELTNNQPLSLEELLVPDDLVWQAYFSFDDVGYIKDDEEIDADDLLKSAQESDKTSNKYRAEQGWSALTTVGWEYPPRYDRVNKRLEWAYILKTEDTGEFQINYHTRVLGRNGVMRIQLAVFPEDLDRAVPELSNVLSSFEYNAGEKYREYKKGDRVAEFGLAALIAGGAAAVASKKGLWAMLVALLIGAKKFAIAIIIALFAGIASIFRRKK